MTKQITDDVTGARQKLIYSREIPTKSMEIQGQPFNRAKGSD